MKKLAILLAAAVLLFGVSGQAMASFSNGDLIQVVYSTNGYETATDLGSVTSLLNFTFDGSAAVAALGAGATYANSHVAYFTFDNTQNVPTGVDYISGNQGGQAFKSSAQSGYTTGYSTVAGYYATLPASSAVLTTNPSSYYHSLDAAGSAIGQMGGVALNGDAEISLAALATTGYVDQSLYSYAPGRSSTTQTVVAADLRTTAAATPVPPSVLLMGSGLLGLVGIRRKHAA
jgi:hypothetical protein